MDVSSSDDNDFAWLAGRRDEEADAREAGVDQRERQLDVRERVLDRWEVEIAARAAAVHLFNEQDEEGIERARARRLHDRQQRRGAAEARRDAGIDRDIRRAERVVRAQSDRSSHDAPETGAEDRLAHLVKGLQMNRPLEDVLELILSAGVETVPGCAAVSVALITQGRLRTAASTATWAARLDAAQLELGSGPVPAATEGGIVTTPDLTSDQRWPGLASLPDRTATRSVISFGLAVGGSGTGVLTLYSELRGAFGRQAFQIGGILAAHAAGALGRTLERLTYEAQIEAWQRALATRDLIGQAKGILMEQRSIATDEAFNLLRATSQRLNVKLRDVAEHLVNHRQLPNV